MPNCLPVRPIQAAVFISGGGTTLKNLLAKIKQDSLPLDIRLVVSSRADAGGLRFALEAQIPSRVVAKKANESAEEFSQRNFEACREAQVDYVLMAGYLKHVLIPADFANRVLNIHPSLIPAFCGQGMYGIKVHQAVLDYGAKLSGCTVHFVDNQFDHGPILLQRVVEVLDEDTPQTLATRVFSAECMAYPDALRLLAEGRVVISGRHVRIREKH
jgi:phosphoribosylglycinamide formyltransferase-1